MALLEGSKQIKWETMENGERTHTSYRIPLSPNLTNSLPDALSLSLNLLNSLVYAISLSQYI